MVEAILSIIVTPITEIVKCLIPSIKRRIDRLIHCQQKIEDLKRKVKDLEDIKDSINRKVDAAEKNLDTVRGVVRTWLQRVEDETNTQNNNNKIVRLAMNGEAMEMINQQRCKGWCFCGSVGAAYDLGEQADNKIIIIDVLLTDGRRIDTTEDVSDPAMPTEDVSDPAMPTEDVSDPAMPTDLVPSCQDLEVFASRESVRKEVMAALMKEGGPNIIGVHGMGGVGKTTLVKQIQKQVKEEKLFDDVVFTTVSRNIDLKRIQRKIGKGLGLNKLMACSNTKTRAKLLFEVLNRQDDRRTLVILDDLWSTQNLLNLSDVGIHHKASCCKVVITTRSVEVCDLLKCQLNINVVVLSEEESWSLFKRSAGDVVDSDLALQSVAKEIAKECGGLPLALVTLGKALIKKDKIVWVDTLRQLKVSGPSNNFTCIEITKDSKIYTSIKLSYDLLGNEIIKKCFLHCCLFPEDYKIKIDNLMAYVTEDDEIFGDLRNLEQVKCRLHTALVKLKDASLLLAVEGRIELTVRMHDVVRDVAILIASEEGNNRFFVKAGLSLKSWEDAGISGSSNTRRFLHRLSLMENDITGELPDQPELPQLLSLSLRGNKNIRKIPDRFFRSVTSLKTLDLSETGISSLPSSLFSLVNLRSLYLNSFGGLDISGIGNLKQLIILSLKSSMLQKIPEELGRLTNLRMLDLTSNNRLKTIPPNVISRMTRLECLKVVGYSNFNKWEVEGWGNGTNASLTEVISLHYLTNLELNLKHERTTTDQDRVEKIEFKIEPTYRGNECTLDVSDPTSICHSIKVLLGRQKKVQLRNGIGLKNIEQLLVSLGVEFKNMKSLTLEYWNEMEYFLSNGESEDEEHITRNAFCNMEELSFESMSSLKEIVHERRPIPMGMFDNMKELKVTRCKCMVGLLSSHLVRRLPNLESLRVFDCDMLKDGVFNFENDDDDEERSTSVAMCSKLRSIEFSFLRNLESIWKGGIIPLGCVENLKRIYIVGCVKLRYLFSASTARRFQQLEELEIWNCENIMSIIKTEEIVQGQMLVPADTDVDDQIFFFPNLKELYIHGCDVLEQLWDNNDTKPTSLLIPQLVRLTLRPQSIGDSLLKEIKGWEDASWDPRPYPGRYVRKV